MSKLHCIFIESLLVKMHRWRKTFILQYFNSFGGLLRFLSKTFVLSEAERWTSQTAHIAWIVTWKLFLFLLTSSL